MRTKRNLAIILVILMFVVLYIKPEENRIFDSIVKPGNELDYFENELMVISLDENENMIYYRDKLEDLVYELIRSPIKKNECIIGFFINKESCYYLTNFNEAKGFNIYRIDLSTFQEYKVFSSYRRHKFDYWGITDSVVGEFYNDISDSRAFYVYGNCAYIIDFSGNLIEVNFKSDKVTSLSNDISDGRYSWLKDGIIYYSNFAYQLTTYNIKNGEKICYENIHAYRLSIVGDTLVYSDILGSEYEFYLSD